MNQDRLFQDFPISVRCESSDTVVFVACPVGGKYGDVRKTLAGLLQIDCVSIGIGAPSSNANFRLGQMPAFFDDDEVVRDDNGDIIIRAVIFKQLETNDWVKL